MAENFLKKRKVSLIHQKEDEVFLELLNTKKENAIVDDDDNSDLEDLHFVAKSIYRAA